MRYNRRVAVAGKIGAQLISLFLLTGIGLAYARPSGVKSIVGWTIVFLLGAVSIYWEIRGGASFVLAAPEVRREDVHPTDAREVGNGTAEISGDEPKPRRSH